MPPPFMSIIGIANNMARTRNAVKRQKVATVESALFNPDVVFLIAALLDARDLCQLSQTCKTLGGKQAAYDGMSLVEAAARQMFGCATDWERSCLPKYDDEGWTELYRHLILLRSKLTFDRCCCRSCRLFATTSAVQTAPRPRLSLQQPSSSTEGHAIRPESQRGTGPAKERTPRTTHRLWL